MNWLTFSKLETQSVRMRTRKRMSALAATAVLAFCAMQSAKAFYNPEIGRWANRDPLGEDGWPNLYAFGLNSPVQYVDPWGLLVFGTFDLGTGLIAVTDEDTGVTVVILGESGGKPWGDPIPTGNFDILNHPDKDFFRLEPLDKTYGDDTHDPTGRDKFRLHRPGRTIGCIAAKDKDAWIKLRELIRTTKTTTMEVKSKSRNPLGPKNETITRFGEIRVIDTSMMPQMPNSPNVPVRPQP